MKITYISEKFTIIEKNTRSTKAVQEFTELFHRLLMYSGKEVNEDIEPQK